MRAYEPNIFSLDANHLANIPFFVGLMRNQGIQWSQWY